jgi:tetratricopeptide (TPR) repeat protein
MVNATSKDLEVAGDLCRSRYDFFEKAIEFYRKALEKDPESISARVELLALTFEIRAQEREQALTDLESLVRRNLRENNLLSRFFNALIELGRYEKMAAFCEDLLKDTSIIDAAGQVRLHRNLAVAYVHFGKTDDAVKQYEAALKLSPTDENTLKAYARLLFELQRLEKAEECARMLLTLDPTDTAYYMLLAEIIRKQGKNDEAGKLLNLALPFSDQPQQLRIKAELQSLEAENVLKAMA